MTTLIRWVSTPALVIVSWLSLLEAVRVQTSAAFDPYRTTYGMDNVNFFLVELALLGTVSIIFSTMIELIALLTIKNKKSKSLYFLRIAIRLPLAGLAIAMFLTTWERDFSNVWFYLAGTTSLITLGDYFLYIKSLTNSRRAT